MRWIALIVSPLVAAAAGCYCGPDWGCRPCPPMQAQYLPPCACCQPCAYPVYCPPLECCQPACAPPGCGNLSCPIPQCGSCTYPSDQESVRFRVCPVIMSAAPTGAITASQSTETQLVDCGELECRFDANGNFVQGCWIRPPRKPRKPRRAAAEERPMPQG
jgi:hypothetical protein